VKLGDAKFEAAQYDGGEGSVESMGEFLIGQAAEQCVFAGGPSATWGLQKYGDTKGGAAAPDGASRASKPAGQLIVGHCAQEQVFRAGVQPALAVWVLDRRETEGYAALGNGQRGASKFPGDEGVRPAAQQRQLVRGPDLHWDARPTRNAQGNALRADLLCGSTDATAELVVGHSPELSEFAPGPRGALSSFGFGSFDGSVLSHRAAG